MSQKEKMRLKRFDKASIISNRWPKFAETENNLLKNISKEPVILWLKIDWLIDFCSKLNLSFWKVHKKMGSRKNKKKSTKKRDEFKKSNYSHKKGKLILIFSFSKKKKKHSFRRPDQIIENIQRQKLPAVNQNCLFFVSFFFIFFWIKT